MSMVALAAPAPAAPGRYVVVPDLLTSDGARLHYLRSGPDDAPRLVLLHGLGSDGVGYDELCAAIGDRLQLARLDLRGHGRSEPITDPARYGWFGRAAADVVELLDALDWDDAGVAGGSLGAATATAVALTYPERVRRLGVFSPAFGAGPGAGNEVAQHFFDAVATQGLLGVLTLLEALPDMSPAVLDEARANWGRQDDAAIRACVTALADAVLLDDLDQLAHVDVPTLVVGRDGDLLHPWALAETYAATLPEARLVALDPYSPEGPTAMARLVVEFFADL
jgi:pimeloyl-ACP methyl ester carboxylesterase